MSKDKKILIHYEKKSRPREDVEVEIVLRNGTHLGSKVVPSWYDVFIDGVKVDQLVRDPRNRTHQVHSRIRYDNSPRVRFKAFHSGIFYQDTRNEAFGDILEGLGLTDRRLSVHIPGRKKWWIDCDLCEEKRLKEREK